MVTPGLPHQNNIQQIGYKLLSMLNFKGKKGEEVARTLISTCLWNDSVESKSRAYDVSPQTVRNYVEGQGVEVIEKLLESARKISLKVLKGVNEIDLSIDWKPRRGTGDRWEGSGVRRRETLGTTQLRRQSLTGKCSYWPSSLKSRG